ncbi:hypothetical protein QJQ45_010939 [Haematococcus lacustris]|nr:hypothetical protein QJQ45_010939 [Haematococcus lacustris]
MATSPASASGNQATILDDDNWPIWSIRTEGLLVEAGLWSVVADGVTPLPTAPAPNATQEERAAYAVELARSRADSALDRKAKAFIQRHVSNLHIFTVKSADSAQDAWETLESQFTESSVARQSQLQQQLSLLRMEPGESVARFYARLQQLLTELEACNCETSESTVVLAILAALPPEYESTVERLRYDQTSADLKVERIKRVLLTKEADLLSKQMQQQLSTSSSSLWSYSSPSDSRGAGSSGGQGGRGRFRLPQQQQQQQQQARAQSPDRSSREVSSHAHLTCNYCAKPGHIMSECFTFDRDQRNRMRTLFSNSAGPSSPGRRPSPGRSSSPAARASSPSRGRAQTPGRTAAQSPSRGASLFTCSTAAAADDDDDDLDDVLMQMVQPKLNFNSDLYSPFCIDSRASQHILKDLQFFYNYTPFAPDKHRPVRLAAEGHRVWAVGSGSVFLSTKRGSWFLSHALYVPDSKQNFISVTAATDEGSNFLFRGDVCQISCNQFGSMLRVNAHKVKNSYILAAVPMPDGPDTDSEQEQGARLYNVQQSALQPDPRIKLELLTNVAAPSANSTTSNSPQVWHQRLCHTSYDALARMQSADMVSGVPVTAAQFRAAASDPAVCVGCVKGKQHKNVAFAGPPPNAAPVTAPLGLIHMDVCGPMHARARDGSLYVATFLDEYTKLSVCVPISSKAQVPDTVRTVIEELETQSGYRCKAIRTDNGTEYVNSRMKEYCASKGIVHQHSAPYSPQQNGAAERLNRTIFEKARSIIHSADISLSFWAHAVKFANHVRCLLPVSGQPLTPWEAFYGVKPDLSGLRVFGCRVWLHIPDHQRSKLQAKSVEGLFIGYEPGSKAYRVLVNGRETCSKDIVFDELSVLQPTRQQDQPAQPVFLLPLPPSPSTPSEPLTPAAPAEGGNSLQQTSSSSSEDSGSISSISRPGSSAQRPQSRPLEGVDAHQDSSSSDSPPSEQEPSQQVSLTARYEPGSHMWHQQQLELISKLPRPGIGRFSLRSMPLARETVGAQPAAASAAARPAAPSAAPAARPTTSAAAPTAARPAAPAAAPPAAPAAVRPSASAAAPTAARPAAPVTAVARPAAAARPGLAQPALRVPLIPTSATARQAAPAVHPSMPMPPAPDPRPASPEAPAAPVPRRNPSRERHRPERFRDSDLFAMSVSDSPVNDTPTVAEALAGPMADLWIEAMNAELASLHANQTWCLEERPANARVLPTKWVLKVKRDAAGNIEKLKARLVAKGFYQQSGVDVGDVYAPVSKHTTLRTLLAKAAAEDMEIHQLDFETAFLNGKLEPGEVIYVQQPEGFEEGSTNTVCRLQKALYGLRQAPRAWHARLCEELLSMGFKASEADPALFTLQLSTGMVYLLVYVDDCLLCTQQGDTAGLAHVKKQLSSAFKLKDLGEARWFLGMQLTRDSAEGTIKLDHHKFIQELVTANSKSAAHSKPLPMAPAVKLVREGDALDTTLHHYSALVGSLLYLTCCTRPDIAFAVGALARHMSAPTKQHWAAACSVLCYLKGTADQGLMFGGVSGLQGFSDADYAGDKDTARSTTGYIFTLNGGAISWSSRLQPTVAMSTAEAEYMAASSAAKEALWLRKLMRDLQLDASCVHLGCDNKAAIQLLHNPMATSRAKHIDVHHHFVRERISRGEGGSGGAPLSFSVGERLRADGLLAKHVAPDERAACAETMRTTARDLISRQLHALGQRVLVLEAVKDREGADDLAELLEQHDVPLLQQQLWWLEKALGIGWAGGQGGPPAHSLYGHPQVLYLPHDVSSAVATWGFGESRKRDAQHQVAERQAKWQRAAGWLLELWLAAAGWAPLGRCKKSSDTSSSSSSSSSPGSSSAVSRSSMQQTWPGLAITPLQPVTSCRLVSCSRARAAVLAEAEAFTGLHPLPLPVPSRSVTCSADARWLAYPGRYLAALKADGVRHLLITTATGQPFLLNRAGALYAYPMQTAPSQPAAAGQEGALGGRAVIEGEEQEVQQAASAGHIVLEEQLQQLSLHSSRAAEGQVAPARACDVVALPPAAPPPCGLPPCTVLDGELVLHGGGAQPLFLVFEALCVAGSPVWQLPLTARLQHLDSLGLTTASEAVIGQAAASVFTPLPALKVSVAVPLPAATAGAPPPRSVKLQQGPPRGQDTVQVLRKPCFPVSPSGLQQLEAAAERCGFPADGVVFSPCAMSCVLGQAELLIKWQPPGCVGVDVLGRLANSPPQPSLMTIDDNIHLQRLRGPGAPDALVRDYMHLQVEVEKVSVNFGATYYHNYHDTQRPGKQQGPAPQPPTITKLEGIAWIMRCLCFDKVMGKSLEALERLTYRICLPWSDLVRAVEHQQQQQQQQTARPPSALHSPTLQSSPVPPNPDLVPAALTSPHPARLLPFSQLYALALAAVQCGSVEVSSDPDTGLQVFNYLAAASPGSSQAAQLCRGLVLHPDSQTLVATPFPRFAAERQLDSPPCTVTRAAATAVAPPPPAGQPSSPAAAAVRAAVKVDGSLIIGFLWQGQVHACTRRRMTSEQAVWAQGQLRANPAFVAHAQPGWTYLFEAVYAANTHVISYPFQGLVLLDAICPEGLGLASGAAKHALAARLGTLAAPELQLQQAEELGSWLQADRASSSSTSSFAVLLSPSTPRPTPSQPLASDGWVVTLGSSGQRSKLVHANFKHAHYEAQLLHPLSVWDRVRQGASRDQLLSFCLPNHLRAEAEAVLAALHRSFDEVRLQHMAKQQAVAAKQHGGREEQPLSMYYSKVQVSLPEGSATPHLRAQLLDLVRPAHDGSGPPGYQPSPAMAQTFAKSWPKGPLAGRLAPSPEPACTAIQRPQFFELVLAALDGISALRASVLDMVPAGARLAGPRGGRVARAPQLNRDKTRAPQAVGRMAVTVGAHVPSLVHTSLPHVGMWNLQLTAAMADLPPLQWAGDVLRNGIGPGRATAGGSAGRDALSSEALAEAFRHVKQVVGDARRDADLYDLLAGTRREETYQPYFSGVRRATGVLQVCPSKQTRVNPHCSQWPGLLRPLSPTIYDLPAMIQEKYRTCQTMCFCGVFLQINRAWASIDNSLFLWRYDRRYSRSGSHQLRITAPWRAAESSLTAAVGGTTPCTAPRQGTGCREGIVSVLPALPGQWSATRQLAPLALALDLDLVSPWSNSRRRASLDSHHIPHLTSLLLCLV